jgi:hypothetical protein
MRDFAFKVDLVAIVRVRTADENVARVKLFLRFLEPRAPRISDWPTRPIPSLTQA